MRLAIIVPFSRPGLLGSVRENVARQSRQPDLVVLARNGRAAGCSAPSWWITAESEPHWSDAKNAGIDAAIAAGGTHAAVFDDDDWYGPGYLDETVHALQAADVVGCDSYRVRTTDGRLWSTAGRGIHGPTLAFRLNQHTPRYERIRREEAMFVIDALDRGMRVASRSTDQFIYQRSVDSAYSATDAELVDALGLIRLDVDVRELT